jgi:hypothetical protein
VGDGVISTVGVGSSVRAAPVNTGVGVSVGAAEGGRVGVGVGFGFGVGERDARGQLRPGMHGAGDSVGGAVVGGGDDGSGQPTPMQGDGLCAEATAPIAAPSTKTPSAMSTRRRVIYISTTRCVSVERTPGRLWICSSTTSASWRSSGISQ